MNEWSRPFGRIESLDGPCIVASYEARMPERASAMRKAGNFAVGQTVGTWVKIPGISERMIQQYQGVVVGLDETGQAPDGQILYRLRIAFPSVNFGGSLTQMMTALVGNNVSTSIRTRLLDLEFRNGAESAFSAPKQGIRELRALTGVYDRPLVLNMIKPCLGYTSEEGLALFRQVAAGGMDLVKDDELLGSPAYNDVAERTALYVKASEELYAETGKRTLYLPNISGRPSQMRDNARRVLDAGGRACLVNYVFGGLDALLELNEEFGSKLFILAHYAGLSVMEGGIENGVYLGLLARLAGAHAVMTMCPDPNRDAAMQDFRKTVQMQRLPLASLPPIVTVVGGGITPVNQQWIQAALGNDVIIGIGGAVQGHPMGPTVGAQTAIYAVDAVAKGISVRDAAEEHEGLRAALSLWPE